MKEYTGREKKAGQEVERGDFMKTLQEALKTGESIDIEFKLLKDKIAVTIWKEHDI